MKKLIAFFVILAMACSMTAYAKKPKFVKAKTDRINVRQAPNAKAPRLMCTEDDSGASAWEGSRKARQYGMTPYQIYNYQTVEVIDESGDWYKIKNWVFEGYSMKKFFEDVPVFPTTYETLRSEWAKDNMIKITTPPAEGIIVYYFEDELEGENYLYFGTEQDGGFRFELCTMLDNPIDIKNCSVDTLLSYMAKSVESHASGFVVGTPDDFTFTQY